MIHSFGNCEVDDALFELRRDGHPVPLEPQAFTVLAYLLRHRDRVVSKEELMDHVWGGRFVSEAAVTSRIKQIRRAVGDDGRSQSVIGTIHGRGYRFVAPLGGTPVDDPPPAAPVAGPVDYAHTDDLHIAYQVTGTGVRDIVLVPGFVSHLELDWADPRHAHFLTRLATFGRLVRFDKRGTGLSDRPPGIPDLETRMHDVLAVMDAAGVGRAVLFGYSEGGPLATLFAAAHPDRVEALVLYGSYAKRIRTDDYPWAPTADERRTYADRLSAEWSWEADLRVMAPSADDAMARWWGQRARAAASPATVRALIEMNSLVDVRAVLPAVRVPTLVLHRRGDRDSRPEEGRYLADHIPGARYVELSGADHFVAMDPDQILDPVEAFLAAPPPAPSPPAAAPPGHRALAAVLAGGAVGDRAVLTDEGRPVVVFDGPATAVRAGLRHLASRPDGPGLGLHVAELTLGADRIEGPGAVTATALADRAAPGELWVTAVVADLVAGSGITVEPRGEHELAGVGPRPVYRAVDRQPFST